MLAKGAVNSVLNNTLFMLGTHAWIFHTFILLCGRYSFLDISYKVFANHIFEISPGQYRNIFDKIMINN